MVKYSNLNKMVREDIIHHIVAISGTDIIISTTGKASRELFEIREANNPKNMIHVVINNGAHETVGGMPTVASRIDITAIVKDCGYPNEVCVETFGEL